MQLKHLKSLTQGSENVDGIQALAWSRNGQKLAVASSDRVITLFDEAGEKKDKFATKAADATKEPNYTITGLCFSADGSKLAVAQSDNSIFVYKLGLEWGEKKSICNKFIQSSEITAIVWPYEQENALVFGLADGKVRLGNLKSNKASTLYQEDSATITMCTNLEGNAIASGHLDGTLCRFFFNDSVSDASQGKFLQHPSLVLSIAWNEHLIVLDEDSKLFSYNKNGSVHQKLDFQQNGDFSVMEMNPTGNLMIIGGFNQIYQFSFQGAQSACNQLAPKPMDDFYAVTSACWKGDGSRLVLGNSAGMVEVFDFSLKRTRYKGKFEFTYTCDSQVIVKRLSTGSRIIIKTEFGTRIEKIDIFRDKFLVAYTESSILLGDMSTCKMSELEWKSTGSERLYFDLDNVCLVFNDGELNIIEYGVNSIIGKCRTEFVNPHLISVCFSEQKYLAYLVDEQTIQINDLNSNEILASIPHDHKINWIELSFAGEKILFKDSKSQLFLYNSKTKTKTCLALFCSYAQWIPLSDVVVAQSGENLLVWYFIDSPENATVIPINGEVETIERNGKETIVRCIEGNKTSTVTLEESLVNFSNCIEQRDYSRALVLLEKLPFNDQTSALWKKIGNLAVEEGNLLIAERAFAALGDISTTRYLRNSWNSLDRPQSDSDLTFRVKTAIINHQFKEAEFIYLQYGMVDEAMTMYQDVHQWENSIKVAEMKGHQDLKSLKKSYEQWLLQTGQDDVAGSIKETERNFVDAVHIYLKGGFPAKAANVITSHKLENNMDLAEKVARALVQSSLFEKAGVLYEMIGDFEQALSCYSTSKSFSKAVKICKSKFPSRTIEFERKWADYLLLNGKYEQSVNHYLECGDSQKALEAAVSGKLFGRAVSIVEALAIDPSLYPVYQQIANYFKGQQEFETAEKFYVKCQQYQQAIDMYFGEKEYKLAHYLAQRFISPDEIQNMFGELALKMEDAGEFKDAETIYCIIGEADNAISMYKQVQRFDQVVRLVETFHPEHITQTHLFIAKHFEKEGSWGMAEKHYLEARDLKAVINMYCMNDMFELAYKAAKANGPLELSIQVMYIWAKSLGGEAAFKLLSKYSLVEQTVQLAIERLSFDFLFSIVPYLNTETVQQIYYKHGPIMEDEGKFQEAEKSFIKASRAREAVLMYLHSENWNAAISICEKYEPESMTDVLLAQAQSAFKSRDFEKMEALVLRTRNPEAAIRLYKEAGMLSEALEFSRKHVPSLVNELSQVQNVSSTASNLTDAYSIARKFELNRKYQEAVKAYLQLDDSSNTDLCVQGWLRAVEVAGKFMDASYARQVALSIIPRLFKVNRKEVAGDLYAGLGMFKESIQAFMDGDAWEKAKKTAQVSLPQMKQLVENAYLQSIKDKHGNDTAVLMQVDVNAGLEAMAKKGQWDQLFESASPEQSIPYLLLFTSKGQSTDHYEKLANYLLKLRVPVANDLSRCYEQLANAALTSNSEHLLAQTSQILKKLDSNSFARFNDYINAIHLLNQRNSVKLNKDFEQIAADISVSLLRYTNVYSIDVALYEAGKFQKQSGQLSIAFAIWNVFLDVCDAVEDQDFDLIDASALDSLGVPKDRKYPTELLPEKLREQVRNWVLQTSIERKISKSLKTRECAQCSNEMFYGLVDCPKCSLQSEESAVSGLAVQSDAIQCASCKKFANRDEWNLQKAAFKTCAWCSQ